MTSNNTVVKKVVVFPIEATLEDSQGIQKVHILKLNLQGAIIEVFNSAYRPQLPVKLKFVLPLLNYTIEEESLVIKTYNQIKGEKNPKKQYLIEVHYKKLKLQTQNVITEFMKIWEARVKKAQEISEAKKASSS